MAFIKPLQIFEKKKKKKTTEMFLELASTRQDDSSAQC